MSSINAMYRKSQGGFSLLEMVVALTILAIALGTLYQAAGGATRNVRTDERYARGVELARSLLAQNGMVPAGGVNIGGESDGEFKWYVKSQPIDLQRTSLSDAHLYRIEVGVNWDDGRKRREVLLHSVVEGFDL